MPDITYKPAATGTAVFLRGKRVGMIVQVEGGYAYRTGSGRRRLWGETFATVAEVKKSCEGDE